MSAIRSTVAIRAPCAGRVTMRRVVKPSRVMVFATQPDGAVKKAIDEAEEACKDGVSPDCAVAWDTVEEISAAAFDKKEADRLDPIKNDPMEAFCETAPSADECRVYED